MTEQELQSIVGSYIAGNSISHTVSNNLRRIAEEQNRQLEESKARLAEYKKNSPNKEEIATVITEYSLKEEWDAAKKYLDNTLANNLIYSAKNTKDIPYSLDEIVESIKNKYRPFYKQIGREMPLTLSDLSADKLCEMLGISKYVPIPKDEWDERMEKLKKDVNNPPSGCLSSIVILFATISMLTIVGCCMLL